MANWKKTRPLLAGQNKYQSVAWQKIRAAVMKRDSYLCQVCWSEGQRPTPATAVDHIKPRAQGGLDNLENLRAICADCHLRVSLEAVGKKIRRRGCDRHGRPLDPNHPWNLEDKKK